MAPAYRALLTWARDGGHALAGVSGEVYGDWDADTSRLGTEIYVLLASSDRRAAAKNSSTS